MLQDDFQNKIDEAYELINNDCESALIIFNDLLDLESDNTDLLNGKGSALMKLNRFDEAEECFNKSLSIDENSSALLNKGIILKNKGEFQGALEFYNNAVQINPNLNNIVLILKKEIIELIDDNILNYNTFSDNARKYIKKGTEYMNEFKLCDALDLFNRAIEDDPSCRHSVSALIEEIKSMLFSEFLFNTPDFKDGQISDLKMDFFKTLLFEENPKEALSLIENILEIEGNDLDTLNFKGCILFLFDKYPEAVECFDKCLDIDEKYYYALFNKALVLRIMNNFKESLICFDILLKEHVYEDKVEFYRMNILEMT